MIPIVVQGRVDRLTLRHVDPNDGTELSPTSGTITIYNSGGTAIVTAAAVTASGSKPYYSRTWDAATFPISERYKSSARYRAEWTLVTGSTTRVEDSYFEVVLRRFRRPIGETDFASRYPYLANLIPSGATMGGYLESAWNEIGNILYSRLGRYPGDVFYPEQLSHVLEQLAVSHIHRAIMIGSGLEDDIKSRQYRDLAMSALETALSFIRIGKDDDKNADEDEFMVINNGELVR